MNVSLLSEFYHFVVDFSHPEMFIVLCMGHSKIRCTRRIKLLSLTIVVLRLSSNI